MEYDIKKNALKIWKRMYGEQTFVQDLFGKWIKLKDYGLNTNYGWNIDHIWPRNPNISGAPNGSDNIKNLQPLHVKSNLQKANYNNGKVKDILYVCSVAGHDKFGNAIGRIKISK